MAAMHPRSAIDDRQAQAGAFAAGARDFQAGERLHYPCDFAFRDAGAAVQHPDDRPAVLDRGTNLDLRIAVAQGVIHQVGDHALRRDRFERQWWHLAGVQPHRFAHAGEALADAGDDLVQVFSGP